MGRTSSRPITLVPSNLGIEVFVEHKQPWYYTGQVVEGNIYVLVRNQHASFNVLRLELVGEEKTHIYIGLNELVDKRQRTSYSNDFAVAQLGQRLTIGLYRFPYAFKLHPDLPGTINHTMENKRPSLIYFLQASLCSNVPGVFPVISNKEPVYVIECCRSPKEPLQGYYTKVLKCGRFTLKMKVSSNSVQAGETVVVNITVDNRQCGYSVKYARLKLVSLLYQYKQPGDRGKEYERNELSCVKTGGVPAGGYQEFPMSLTIPNIAMSTAIGHYCAFYYLVEATAKIAGLSSEYYPKVLAHIFVAGPVPQSLPKYQYRQPPGMEAIIANKYVQPYPNELPTIPRYEMAAHFGIYNKGSAQYVSILSQPNSYNSYRSSSFPNNSFPNNSFPNNSLHSNNSSVPPAYMQQPSFSFR